MNSEPIKIQIESIYSAVDGSDTINVLGRLDKSVLTKIEESVQIRKGYERKKFSAFKKNIITINNPFTNDTVRSVEGWGESECGSFEFGSIGNIFNFDLYQYKIRFLLEPSMEIIALINTNIILPFYTERYSFQVGKPSREIEEEYTYDCIDFEIDIRRKIISNEDFKKAVVDALKALYFKMCQKAFNRVSEHASKLTFRYDIEHDNDDLPF